MEQDKCKIYKKHHNIIDGVYTVRLPQTWEEIPFMDDIDADDEDKELYRMFLDIKIYDIENIIDFNLPTDEHGIEETIFIIRRNGMYYLCETQGDLFVKFASNISNVDFIQQYDRASKIMKICENINIIY